MLWQIHIQYVQKDVHKSQLTCRVTARWFDRIERLVNAMHRESFEEQIHGKMVDEEELIHILNNNFYLK